MKTIFEDDDIIIYISKIYKEINLNDIETYLKKIFIKLEQKYKLKLIGYYIVDVYIDKYFGGIIKIKKEDLEYIDYYDDETNMQINIHPNSEVLYQVDDSILLYKEDWLKIDFKDNKLYAKITKNVNDYQLGKLLEMCNSIVVK